DVAKTWKRYPHQAKILQAPHYIRNGSTLPLAENYSDILLRCGFADADELFGLVQSWQAIYLSVQPDLILVEHAPAAMLAARSLGLAYCLMGTGFTVPPNQQSPMPTLQPWKPDPVELRQKMDMQVLENVNRVLAASQHDPITQVSELLHGDESILLTWPETDHYGERSDGHYMGPILDTVRGHEVEKWATARQPRIFAYLSARYRHFQPMLDQLLGGPANLLIHARDFTYSSTDVNSTHNIHISPKPLDAEWAMEYADLVICHGGQATTLFALKTATPLLILPQQLEQAVLAYRLNESGLASSLHSGDNIDWSEVIATLLEQSDQHKRLQDFSRKYATHDSDQVSDQLASRIDQLV
nr:hypothetical protein [Gammaproteobacteria bacterium]